MSILFDDAASQYALAANPAVAFPFAVSCWAYLDDLDATQTFAALQDAASEDNYYSLGVFGKQKEVTDITAVGNGAFEVTDITTLANGIAEVTDVTTVANGVAEVTDVTTVADVAQSLLGKYFTISSPTTDYYVWFSFVAGVGDPAPVGPTGIEVLLVINDTADAVALALQLVLDAHGDFGASVLTNVVTVTNAATGTVTDALDVDTTFTVLVTTQGDSSPLENKYFTINSPTTAYYVWFHIDGGSVDPAPGGTGIQVTIVDNDTADAVALALQLVLDAHGDFGASVLTNVVTVTNVATGAVTDAVDVDTTFTVGVTTQGDDSPLEDTYFLIDSTTVSYYVWFHIDGGSVDPAPGGVGIQVTIVDNDTADAVALALQLVLDGHVAFGASVSTNVVTVTHAVFGDATDAVDGDSGFTIAVTTQGADEALEGTYFLLSSPTIDYYVWFSLTTGVNDPAPAGPTGIEVEINDTDNADAVALALQLVLDAHGDFGASVLTDTVTVTNATSGLATDAADFDTGFTIGVTNQGTAGAVLRGELVDNLSVSEIADSPGTLVPNSWHHFLAVFNTATDIRVYLDGANEGLSPGGAAVAPIGLDTLSIGRLSTLTPGRYTSGRVAELTTWNLTTVFNTNEINDLGADKSSSLLVRTDELLYFAPMYNNDDPIIDIMFHANATLFNAPTTADHPPVQTFEPETFQRFRSGPVEFNLGEDDTPPFSDLLFVQSANWELERGASNNIGFNQQVQHNVILVSVASSISFGQVLNKTSTLNVSVETNVNFSQNMGPTTEESLSSSITFGVEASRGEHAISQIQFTSDVVGEASKGVENDVLFGQSVTVQLDLNPVAASSISFGQVVLAWISNPRCLLGGVQTTRDTILLSCGAASVELKNPSFGNSESIDVDRVVNVSRGGTTNFMRDLAWPQTTTLNIQVDNLKEAKAQEVSDFLLDCLGKLVSYTNYEGRVWEGVILNPGEALIEERLDRWTVNLELIGNLV